MKPTRRIMNTAMPTMACATLALATLLPWVLVSLAAGQDIDIQQARQAAKDGLESGRFPWYDAENDTLERVDLESNTDDFSGRHSSWQRKPKNPTAAGRGGGSTFSKVLEPLIWMLATATLAVIIGLLVWAFVRSSNQPTGEAKFGDTERPVARIDRIEELPVQVQAIRGDLLEQARRHYATDNLRDAIICLFSYKLIQLDNHQAIHLERGKTNRQYLRELRTRRRLRHLLEGTMLAFEDVFFGNYELPRERFERCLHAVDEFQAELAQIHAGGTG